MHYKISELAELAGISSRTLRHYDEVGLLKPRRLKESNYRIYDENQVNELQHILILKEMGFELNQIMTMIKDLSESKRMKMLEEHLLTLEHKKNQIERIIHNVNTTIKSMKGEVMMKDQDKFEGLKEKMIEENDQHYKDEVIEKWGLDAYEKSRNAFKNFTQEEFVALNALASKLIETLQAYQKNVTNMKLRKEVYEIHKKWLTTSWGGTYNKEAHFNLVEMYVADERFKKYYDQHGKGLAEMLKDACQKEILGE